MIVMPGLLVALVSVLVLSRYHRRQIVWWELLFPPLLSLVLGLSLRWLVLYSQTADIEFWGTWPVAVEHQESWTEWRMVDDYCTKTEPDGRGGSRVVSYKCGEHMETTYHPEQYRVQFDSGDVQSINEAHYEVLALAYGQASYERRSGHYYDLHRMALGGAGWLHHYDWPGTAASFRPATVRRVWHNRVQASNNLYNFPPVSPRDKQRLQLLDYPPLYDFYRQDAIVGPEGPVRGPANDRLMELNARLGRAKQVRMFIFLYYDQPLEAALRQRDYLVGGNKNEFILCLGLSRDQQVRWSYVISWCERQALPDDVQQFALQQSRLQLPALVEYLGQQVGQRFVRRQFKQFDYLTVTPPWWAQLLCLLGCAGAQCLLGYVLVHNQHRPAPSYQSA